MLPETQSYGYDTFDRLTSAAVTGSFGYSETYAYHVTSGNLTTKGTLTLAYGDAGHVHAVTAAGGNTYAYDANGNQTTRVIGADTYNLKYDAENRLVEVKKNNVVIAAFTFDGDGKRVKSVINGTTTLFIGGHYEIKNPGAGQEVSKYYFAGAARIAMRKYAIPVSMAVEYFIGDHLGSTSITTDTAGVAVSRMRYKAWGEVRSSWTSGISTTPAYILPKYTYTGQYSNVDDFGLMFYNARWYDPASGRFNQPDTIIPQNQGTQAWDRYSYSDNNPVRYSDPSGHWIESVLDAGFIAYDIYDICTNGLNWENGLALAADAASLALPIVTGGGLAVRAAMHADDVVKAANAADNAADLLNTIDNATETLTQTEKLVDSGASAEKTFPTLEESVEAFKDFQGNNPGKVTILGYKEDIEMFVKGIENDVNYLIEFDKWSPEFNLDVWLKNAVDSGNPIAVISDLSEDANRFVHAEVARLNEWGASFIELRR